MNVEWIEILVANGVLALGSVLQAATGLGAGLVVVPLLALLHLAGRFGNNEMILGLALLPGVAVGYLLAGYLSPCIDRGYSRIAVLLISSFSAGLLILRSI